MGKLIKNKTTLMGIALGVAIVTVITLLWTWMTPSYEGDYKGLVELSDDTIMHNGMWISHTSTLCGESCKIHGVLINKEWTPCVWDGDIVSDKCVISEDNNTMYLHLDFPTENEIWIYFDSDMTES